jgi:hypothetical protein
MPGLAAMKNTTWTVARGPGYQRFTPVGGRIAMSQLGNDEANQAWAQVQGWSVPPTVLEGAAWGARPTGPRYVPAAARAGFSPAARSALMNAVYRAELAPDAAALVRSVEASVLELTLADRAICMLVEADRGGLWTPGSPGRSAFEGGLVGVTGAVARAGIPLFTDRAGGEPLYRQVIDDPSGSPDDGMAAVPVLDSRGVVVAIILAFRTGDERWFATPERRLLRALAERMAAPLSRLHDQRRAERARLRGAGPWYARWLRLCLPLIALGALLVTWRRLVG